MKHLQSGVEERKTSQQKSGTREIEAQTVKSAQGSSSRPEVPCSCPGCFPFDF